MKIIRQKVERLCIGNDVNSILFSHHYNVPIIIHKPHIYSRFHLIEDMEEHFIKKYDLAPNVLCDFRSGKECTRYSSLEIIEKALPAMSANGLVWPSFLIKNIVVNKEASEIDLVLTNNLRIVIQYEKLFILNSMPYEIYVSEELKKGKKYEVHDYFKVLCVKPHEINFLKLDDHFINEVHMYHTIYKSTKDVVSISFLDEVQLESGDYETYHALFKTKKILKDCGITGKINKYDKVRNKVYYLDLQLEHSKRIIYENPDAFDKKKINNIFYYNAQGAKELLNMEGV
jgi:hypothetical protein